MSHYTSLINYHETDESTIDFLAGAKTAITWKISPFEHSACFDFEILSDALIVKNAKTNMFAIDLSPYKRNNGISTAISMPSCHYFDPRRIHFAPTSIEVDPKYFKAVVYFDAWHE